MGFNNLIKFGMFIIILFVVYFRKHYYILIIAGIIYFAYRFDLHKKLYDLIDKISGNTKVVVADKNKKSKYLKKLFRNGGGEI